MQAIFVVLGKRVQCGNAAHPCSSEVLSSMCDYQKAELLWGQKIHCCLCEAVECRGAHPDSASFNSILAV